MKLKYLSFMASAFLATAFLASCSSDDVVQNGQDSNNGNNGNVTGVVFEGTTQTPTSRAQAPMSEISDGVITSPSASTRTTATHTIGAGAKVAWETTDKIWVLDDDGVTFQPSGNATFPDPANEARGYFNLTTGNFTGTSHQVTYTGRNGTSGTEVVIKNIQQQTAPNSFAHLGESGDCGVATATKSAATGKYGFQLQHKAAYLCLLPRTENPTAANFVVKSVTVQADKEIAGNFTLSAAGLSATPTANGSKSIKLTLPNYPLTNATSPATNAIYVVMAPQTTALNIIYELYDAATNTTGTVTKNIPTATFQPGTMYDITSNLVKDYTEETKPYMWDAEKWYYYGKTAPYTAADAPQSKLADPDRWYNDAFTPGTAEVAVNSCKDCPTNVQFLWYIMNAPYKDDEELWTADGKIYKGVMRFKRWADLVADDGASLTTLPSTTGTTAGWIDTDPIPISDVGGRNYPGSNPKDIQTGIPAPSLLTKYFAVPGTGTDLTMGNRPTYWSSRGHAQASVFSVESAGFLTIANFACWVGSPHYIELSRDTQSRVMKFE